MYRGSVYQGQRNSTASRMGSYGGGAFSTGMEMGRALKERIADNDGKIGKYKGLDILQKFKKETPRTNEEFAGPMPQKNYIGERPGIDFLQDDKGLFQGGEYVGPSMKDAFGGIRKYFGDRLGAMQKENAPATGDGNVKNTVVETAPPASVNANEEGLSSAQKSMENYRNKNWNPENEDWYTQELGQQYGWDGSKYGDMPQEEKSWFERVTDTSNMEKNPDGSLKVVAGTAPVPFLGIDGIGDAWDGIKSLWGGLTK